MKNLIVIILLVLFSSAIFAEDGHQLWLRNKDAKPVKVLCSEQSQILDIAKQELINGWQGEPNTEVVLELVKDTEIKGDGYKLNNTNIRANTDLGILYGVYDLLRRQKTNQRLRVEILSNPSYDLRLLNHWDNLDGSIERGYAGKSIFWRDEDELTVTEKDRELWKEYARANASIGINASVLNNVNSSPKMLASKTLVKVKEIADVLRQYGIRTYLSVNFSSPAVLDGLENSDPLNEDVINWWNKKVKEIYSLIPDFGGFLVKANSEGQPGPQDYGRTHADGANMLADALQPYNGVVMWRAFVYSPTSDDRAKQAYAEFMPLDGEFRDNVIIQVKNGPVDFQPREPFNPLFGSMKKTSVMPELQITQEYLGQSIHLVYLGTMWEEFLKSDTYEHGEGSTVARCTDGSFYPNRLTAIAGVANIGLDRNWCGHHFSQSNWYAFGRLAWDDNLTSDQIADEWLKLTFTDPTEISYDNGWLVRFFNPVKQMMMESREAAVNYMMPLGLHHLFAGNHHYGPGPWYAPDIRPDWTPPYYHKADMNGIGFNRTKDGSNAVIQYHEPLASRYNNVETCPETYLLWFHHLPWDYKMKSGRTLWDELCYLYDDGVQQVKEYQKLWDSLKPYVDEQRYEEVQSRLRRQGRDAQIWKDGSLLYFQQFSQRPIPYYIERPIYDLDYLESIDPLTYEKLN